MTTPNREFGGHAAQKLLPGSRRSIELRNLVHEYLEGDSNQVVNDFESEPGFLLVKAKKLREPPTECSLLLGEVCYHWRSLLDYIACDMAEVSGGQINSSVEFPIFTDETAFGDPKQKDTAAWRRLHQLHPDFQRLIVAEQPFNQGLTDPEDDPLALLHELAKVDRHRFLHLAATITRDSFQEFDPPELASRFELVEPTYGPVQEGSIVARYRVVQGPAVTFEVRSNVKFDLAFAPDGVGRGLPLLQTVGEIGLRIGFMVERMLPEVGRIFSELLPPAESGPPPASK